MAFKMKKGSPMYRNFGIGGDVNKQIAKDESKIASEKSPVRQSIEPAIEGQPKTYRGTATSVKSQMNKANRLAGKTISYEDAWQGMSSGVRKSKYDNNFDTFVSDSKEFKKTNSNYEKGSSNYSNFQGKF
tara:strand:- start:25 stop:414 length:390 start_codon:yes stop_codon:yes gene_type:complete